MTTMKMKAWGIFVGHCTVSTQHTMVEVTMQESGYEPSVFHISYFMLKTGGFAKIISNRDLKIHKIIDPVKTKNSHTYTLTL